MDESIDRPDPLTGDGLCEELAPDVFVLLDDGLAYMREGDTIFAEANGNPQGGRGHRWIKGRGTELNSSEHGLQGAPRH